MTSRLSMFIAKPTTNLVMFNGTPGGLHYFEA